ncbi:MAG: nucleotidyltransferase domain-containing protein [Nocardioides sp.]
MAPLEPGYVDLLSRVVDHLEGDPRVRAIWLSGSVGRGVADAGSDLDLVVTVADASAFEDASVWGFVDPVVTIPIAGLAGFVFTTRQGLRLDVVLETPADVASSPYTHRVGVLDRDGLAPPVPTDEESPPDVGRMQGLVTEVLRQCAIFPAAVVAREDWLLGQVAVQNHQQLLYLLLVESNQPLPVMGLKQWSIRLTADQRDLLAGLPVPRAERASVVAAMTAVRAAIRTEGRAALESAGGTWPTEVDDALAAYWERHGLA